MLCDYSKRFFGYYVQVLNNVYVSYHGKEHPIKYQSIYMPHFIEIGTAVKA